MDENIILKGTLSTYKSPEANLIFNIQNEAVKFNALFDTGAFYNHITESTLLEIADVPHIGYRKVGSSMGGVQNQPVVELEFKIEGIEISFVEKFNVVGGYAYPIIIGTEFISRFKAFNYYGPQNSFELIL